MNLLHEVLTFTVWTGVITQMDTTEPGYYMILTYSRLQSTVFELNYEDILSAYFEMENISPHEHTLYSSINERTGWTLALLDDWISLDKPSGVMGFWLTTEGSRVNKAFFHSPHSIVLINMVHVTGFTIRLLPRWEMTSRIATVGELQSFRQIPRSTGYRLGRILKCGPRLVNSMYPGRHTSPTTHLEMLQRNEELKKSIIYFYLF